MPDNDAIGAILSLGPVVPAIGGIDPEKAKRYLALSNVVCVGGSWLVPRDAMLRGEWSRITGLARATVDLRGGTA